MKRFAIKAVPLMLATVMALAIPSGAMAQGAAQTGSSPEKEEVVYVNLGGGGSVENIYVVNAFDVTADGTVTDYGLYSAARNLTTDDKITVSGDTVSFRAPKGRFYYQGNMGAKPIPWQIGTSYTLDGKAIEPSALAGKSGKLEIHISVKQNKSVDEVFFKHFALQTTVTLDTEKCSNISADGATVANSGSDRLLTYTILPDQEKEMDIQADVTDFEMDGIQMNGIPLHLDIEKPDTTEIKDKIHDLQDGASDLDDGAKDMEDGSEDLYGGAKDIYNGAKKLDTGAQALQSGAQTLKDGIAELSKKSGTLTEGSAQVKAAIDQINAGLAQLSGAADQLKELKAGSAQYLASMKALYGKIKGLPASSRNIYGAIQQSADALAAASSHDDALAPVVDALKTSADPNVQALVAAYTAKSAVIKQLRTGLSGLAGKYKDFDDGVAQTVAAVKSLSQAYAAMDRGIQKIPVDGLLQLTAGVQELAQEYAKFDAGVGQYTDAFAQISSGYAEVYSGITGLADGIADLKAGAKQLYNGANDLTDGAQDLSDGTGELVDKTSDMDTQVDDEVNDMVDKYTKQDYTLKSFASEKNTNIRLVQFVIKTEDITLPEKTAAASEESTAAPDLWDKLVSLFK